MFFFLISFFVSRRCFKPDCCSSVVNSWIINKDFIQVRIVDNYYYAILLNCRNPDTFYSSFITFSHDISRRLESMREVSCSLIPCPLIFNN